MTVLQQQLVQQDIRPALDRALNRFSDCSECLAESVERTIDAMERFVFTQDFQWAQRDELEDFDVSEVGTRPDLEPALLLDEQLAEANRHLRRLVAAGRKLEGTLASADEGTEVGARVAGTIRALFPRVARLKHVLRRAKDVSGYVPLDDRVQRSILARISELTSAHLGPLTERLRPALPWYVAEASTDIDNEIVASSLGSLEELADLGDKVGRMVRRFEAARAINDSMLSELAAVTTRLANSIESAAAAPLIWAFLQREREEIERAHDQLVNAGPVDGEHSALATEVLRNIEVLRRAATIVNTEPTRPVTTFPDCLAVIDLGWRSKDTGSAVTYEVTNAPVCTRVQLFGRDPLGKVVESVTLHCPHGISPGEWLEFSLGSPLGRIHSARLQALA